MPPHEPCPGPHPDKAEAAPAPGRVLTVCLGSSCFARGNDEHLPRIQDWLRERGMEERVRLRGSRCEGMCQHGPNLKVDGELIRGVAPGTLEAVLEAAL